MQTDKFHFQLNALSNELYFEDTLAILYNLMLFIGRTTVLGVVQLEFSEGEKTATESPRQASIISASKNKEKVNIQNALNSYE
jgi:hypothetical protein